jgi:CheY-like chemotaxis protein
MKNSGFTVLLADDDEVDVMAVKRMFRDLKITNSLIEAQDGLEALARLRGENGCDKVASPCLVLLDLKMPRMGGLEFLSELRSDPLLHDTLVFVMTTSNSEEDRRQAYGNNVAGYVQKDLLAEGFLRTIKALLLYWQIIEFPPAP